MNCRPVVVGALAILTSGCSMVLVDGPPGYIEANEPVPLGSCTTERIIPLVDAVGAVAGVATALTNSDGNAVRFGAVAGAALGFSSYTGFRRVGACRARINLAYEERRSLSLLANPAAGGPALYSRPLPGGLPGGTAAAPLLLWPVPATPLLSPDPEFPSMPRLRLQPRGKTSAPVKPRW